MVYVIVWEPWVGRYKDGNRVGAMAIAEQAGVTAQSGADGLYEPSTGLRSPDEKGCQTQKVYEAGKGGR